MNTLIPWNPCYFLSLRGPLIFQGVGFLINVRIYSASGNYLLPSLPVWGCRFHPSQWPPACITAGLDMVLLLHRTTAPRLLVVLQAAGKLRGDWIQRNQTNPVWNGAWFLQKCHGFSEQLIIFSESLLLFREQGYCSKLLVGPWTCAAEVCSA